LLQVTVVPTATVSGFGANPPAPRLLAPFGMATVTAEAVLGVVVLGVVVLGVLGLAGEVGDDE
jgi:hypothetical protein